MCTAVCTRKDRVRAYHVGATIRGEARSLPLWDDFERFLGNGIKVFGKGAYAGADAVAVCDGLGD